MVISPLAIKTVAPKKQFKNYQKKKKNSMIPVISTIANGPP